MKTLNVYAATIGKVCTEAYFWYFIDRVTGAKFRVFSGSATCSAGVQSFISETEKIPYRNLRELYPHNTKKHYKMLFTGK